MGELTEHRPPRKASVVIPVLNASRTISDQLTALAEQTYQGDWEVVLADNGSTDRSQEVAQRWRSKLPALQLIEASDRPGATHARNRGIAAATGDFIALCDADDVVDPGWLAAIVELAGSYDLVGGRLSDERLNAAAQISWRPQHIGELPTAMNFLPYALSANCGGWKAVFDALGGWNESYTHGGDDIEFFWRAQLAGYRLGYAPDAVVHYRYRTSLSALTRQMFHYGMADAQLYDEFRDAGARAASLREATRSVAGLVLRTPLMLSPRRRGRLVRRWAQLCGRLRGSLRHRVLFVG